MPFNITDRFLLWSFGYRYQPEYDDPAKIRTSRGRTPAEAWTCVQRINRCFLEPEKVGLLAFVSIADMVGYSETHRYDWLKEPPMWLKRQEGVCHTIWK